MRFSHRCRWRCMLCEIRCLSLGVYFQTFRKFIVPASCSSSPRGISGNTVLFSVRNTHPTTKCHVLENQNQMSMLCLCRAVFRLTSVPRTRTQACQRISLIFLHGIYSNIHPTLQLYILFIFRCLCLQGICPVPGSKIMYRNAQSVLTTSRFFLLAEPQILVLLCDSYVHSQPPTYLLGLPQRDMLFRGE
jgi:hypothetical protein